MRELWNESKLTMRVDGASEAPGGLLAVRGRLRVFP